MSEQGQGRGPAEPDERTPRDQARDDEAAARKPAPGTTGSGTSGSGKPSPAAGASGKAPRKGAAPRPDRGAPARTGKNPTAKGATAKSATAKNATAKNLPATSRPAEPDSGGALGDLLAPVAGFGVTMSTLFRPVVTEQYPFQKTPTLPRYHGRHQLNRYADGLEKCIGCELCAWACPADAIYVEAGNNTPEAQYSPGERYGKVYQINYLRCIFCGLCIEACPTRALTMTNEYELASTSRAEMIFEKDDLLAPLRSGMLAAPHPMAAGTDDDDYYRNEISGPSPDQLEWVREHRPDDESLASASGSSGQPAGGVK